MLLTKKLGWQLCLASLLCLGGCQDNPGTWPVEKVTEQVEQSLAGQEVRLVEISLSATASGSFEGVGKAEDGETFQLSVTQDAAAQRLTWKANGDRGSILDGYYEIP